MMYNSRCRMRDARFQILNAILPENLNLNPGTSSSFIVIQEQEARVKLTASIVNILKMYHLHLHSILTYIYMTFKCVESRVESQEY